MFATVTVDWSIVAGGGLLLAGLLGTLAAFGSKAIAWLNKPPYAPVASSRLAPVNDKASVPVTRGADDAPPVGSVDWVCDIVGAMGLAEPKTILMALMDGTTRDQARMVRIAELEKSARPAGPVKSVAVTESSP